MSIPSLRYMSRPFLAGGILMLALMQLASAQSRRNHYDIRIFAQSETCYYHIDQQAEQDMFRIAPQGIVRFYTDQAVWANIEVENDAQGRSGTQGNGRVALQQGKPVASVVVRETIGEDTEHKVRIRCCLDRSPNGCADSWLDAQPYDEAELGLDTRGVEDAWSAILLHSPTHGPHAPDGLTATPLDPLPPTPMPGGGPVMEIDE